MALPNGAVGWSAVCDCCISWSYSLTFCKAVLKSGIPHLEQPNARASVGSSSLIRTSKSGAVQLQILT